MKKKFLSFILCLALVFTSLLFVGCDKSYSKEDVGNLYSSMKTEEETKDFFLGNSLQVTFEGVSTDISDKGYIFPGVYDYYLKASSCLFFNVVDRFDDIASISDPMAYAVKDFTKEQINDIYTKLDAVKKCLKELYNSKVIYEMSEAQLHYQQVLSDYNNLISSLFNLNFAFSNYYFSSIGKVDFSKEETELSNSNMRDMLGLVLLKLSKVTFNYEVLNYTPSNPLGEVKNSWIDKTEYMKYFLTLCSQTLTNLNNTNDLTLSLLSNAGKVKTLFINIQNMFKSYETQYKSFVKALNKFNAKGYFVSTNKTAFLQNSSQSEKSSYRIMQNFLNGKYKALFNGLNKVNSYI